MIETTPIVPRVVVLCATDLTPASTEAALAAARFAELPGGELHFVHVTNDDLSDKKTLDRVGERMAEALRRTGVTRQASFHVSTGTPWRAIAQVAANLRADLLVVGTHDRHGFQRAVLGSVASAVVERAPCPVYVARPVDYSAAEPEIEPPCPECVAMQFETRGAKLWCARHAERHVHGHLHYEVASGFGQGSQLLQT